MVIFVRFFFSFPHEGEVQLFCYLDLIQTGIRFIYSPRQGVAISVYRYNGRQWGIIRHYLQQSSPISPVCCYETLVLFPCEFGVSRSCAAVLRGVLQAFIPTTQTRNFKLTSPSCCVPVVDQAGLSVTLQ